MKHLFKNGLFVTDYGGNGLPLIFIHAFPLSSVMWKKQIEYFKSKFRIITYDVRGLGKSESSDNQFTMELYANDLLQIISEFKLQNIFACGLSMGGYIILRAVIKNPSAFKAIILADTKAERDDDNGIINRSNLIMDLKKGKKKEFEESFIKKLINDISYKKIEIKTFIEKMIETNTINGICGSALAMATRINSIDYLDKIEIPVLLIVGEDDELTPVINSEKMKSLLKNSYLNVIPNSGHLSNMENPDEFNRVVVNFLNSFI